MDKKDIIRAVLFCFIVVITTLKQSFFFGYYALFTEDFVASYCINKNQPELNCDGKCFLSDLIDDQDKDVPEIPLHVQLQLVYLYNLDNLNLIVHPIASNQNFKYLDFYTYQFSSTAFRPPSV